MGMKLRRTISRCLVATILLAISITLASRQQAAVPDHVRLGSPIAVQEPSNVWTGTGSLISKRALHTATLLGNGKVLVAGGNDGSPNNIISSSELYDPATGTWSATAAMSAPRQYHTATLLPNGKVLVAGSGNPGNVGSASVELYDPANGTWSPTGPMVAARYEHTATLLGNGKVLVTGGKDGSRYLNSAELYDPATGIWTLTGSMVDTRFTHTATLLANGKVLVAGGSDPRLTGPRATAELYDPSTGTWTATGSMGLKHALHTATLLSNGKVLVAGGSDPIATTETYDPATGTWTVTGSLNTARHQHTATLLGNGQVLVAGGVLGATTLASSELYEPATGVWTTTASMLDARALHTATLLNNGLVLGVGGNLGGTLARAELYGTTGWVPTTVTSSQVEIKTWTFQGRTYAYVKLTFPTAGFRVASWGQVTRAGNDFSVDALVEQFTGASIVQAVTTAAQIYDLGPLADSTYSFTFKNSGAVVKSQAFSVSSAVQPPNPIDNAREFVRQQYRDFLNREADQAGEDFWTDNITKCLDPARRPAGQTEAQCTLRQRETTSAAFFLSPEFQYTGYYVYRMYLGALGRPPKLSEFIPDVLFVANGVVVNGQLQAEKINQNKAAFAQQFVNCTDSTKYRCAEFKGIYASLNNQQYVDKLIQTTGLNLSASDRADLVNRLNSGESRASMLQKVVDGINVISEGNQQFTTTYGKEFYDQQFNRAFVLLEYFGYLKRDPDDAGYTFWLAKLNQFGGNYVSAEMVLAFISSPEYRARFGQP
jgi:WD40 repeat protein